MKFDKERFLNSELFKAVSRDRPLIEKEADQFREQFAEFLRKDGGEIGRVLTCHLAIEFYLERFLRAANPNIGAFDRLPFSRKLELANGPGVMPMKLLYRGIRQLAVLRNRLSHDLTADISDNAISDIEPLTRVGQIMLGLPERTGVGVIEDFTLFACMILDFAANSCTRYGEGKGYGAFDDWLTKAAEGFDLENAQRTEPDTPLSSAKSKDLE